jgi:hypothetical protein
LKFAVIHVKPDGNFASISPIRRCLLALLLLAIKDRATKISHEYDLEFSRLDSLIDGEWHPLEPLPEVMGPLVGEEVRRWINPNRLSRTLAENLRALANHFEPQYRNDVHYPFLLIVDPIWSIWGVSIGSSSVRGNVDFELLECSEWCHEQSIELFKTLRAGSVNISEEEVTKFYP